MAVLVCKTSEIRLPVYALVLALMLAAVFALPMAIIQALSSSQIGLNVLSEVVCGYLLRKCLCLLATTCYLRCFLCFSLYF